MVLNIHNFNLRNEAIELLSKFNSLLKLDIYWKKSLIDLDILIKNALIHMKGIISLSLMQ